MSKSVDYDSQVKITQNEKFKRTYIAVDNLVVLGTFNDLQNLLDGPVNIGANTANENSFLSGVFTCVGTKFNHKGFVLANDTVKHRMC